MLGCAVCTYVCACALLHIVDWVCVLIHAWVCAQSLSRNYLLGVCDVCAHVCMEARTDVQSFT